MYVSKKTARKRKPRQSRNFLSIDFLIYIFVFLAPIMTLSQLINVWMYRKIEGVAILTWLSYAIIAFFWMIYGIKQKEKPLIYGNLLIFIIDSLIVVGVLFHTRLM